MRAGRCWAWLMLFQCEAKQCNLSEQSERIKAHFIRSVGDLCLTHSADPKVPLTDHSGSPQETYRCRGSLVSEKFPI
jgi:hypothetical protein